MLGGVRKANRCRSQFAVFREVQTCSSTQTFLPGKNIYRQAQNFLRNRIELPGKRYRRRVWVVDSGDVSKYMAKKIVKVEAIVETGMGTLPSLTLLYITSHLSRTLI